MIPEILTALAAILACAMARRIAGGLWPLGLGTQGNRAAAAAIVAGVVFGLSGQVWWALGAAPLAFAGYAAGFPPGGMVPRSLEHVGGLSQQHGWAAAGPFALAAATLGLAWWPLVIAALLAGPCYWLATLWQPRFCPLGLNRDGLPDPPPLAELYFGALLGLALYLAARLA